MFLQDIERIAKFGASVHPETLRRKLNSWDEYLDEELLKYKTEWSRGGNKKYQLIGDNWDRNIIPSYRTSQDKTLSLHLFQVIGVVDRVDSLNCAFDPQLLDILELTPVDFIPSVADQDILLHELTFLVANAVIANIEQLNGAFGYIYPKHLKHKYSEFSGMKTEQVRHMYTKFLDNSRHVFISNKSSSNTCIFICFYSILWDFLIVMKWLPKM